MGILPPTLRLPGVLSLLLGLLPAVRDLAHETLSRAREHYRAGRETPALRPTESRHDSIARFPRVLTLNTGRLARLLVDARPMGP